VPLLVGNPSELVVEEVEPQAAVLWQIFAKTKKRDAIVSIETKQFERDFNEMRCSIQNIEGG
jgi:hypothetical protein